MCLRRKKKGRSKVLSGGLCLRYSEAEERALQWMHICCSIVDSYSSGPESNKQNPGDRALDLPFFFRYKNRTYLQSLPSPAPVSLTGFRATFAAMFVFELLVERIPFGLIASNLRREPKQLMLLYYKICLVAKFYEIVGDK